MFWRVKVREKRMHQKGKILVVFAHLTTIEALTVYEIVVAAAANK